jgi:hypothetical protein
MVLVQQEICRLLFVAFVAVDQAIFDLLEQLHLDEIKYIFGAATNGKVEVSSAQKGIGKYSMKTSHERPSFSAIET